MSKRDKFGISIAAALTLASGAQAHAAPKTAAAAPELAADARIDRAIERQKNREFQAVHAKPTVKQQVNRVSRIPDDWDAGFVTEDLPPLPKADQDANARFLKAKATTFKLDIGARAAINPIDLLEGTGMGPRKPAYKVRSAKFTLDLGKGG